MPKTEQTDLQVLHALLSLPSSQLTDHEKPAFQAMYDDLATGRRARLTLQQRLWADSVYDKHDLDKERPPARKVEIKDRGTLGSLDSMPKPLKPPGRK